MRSHAWSSSSRAWPRTQEHRVAVEEMYRELSRSADDRVLAEVEQILILASQQLQLRAT